MNWGPGSLPDNVVSLPAVRMAMRTDVMARYAKLRSPAVPDAVTRNIAAHLCSRAAPGYSQKNYLRELGAALGQSKEPAPP